MDPKRIPHNVVDDGAPYIKMVEDEWADATEEELKEREERRKLLDEILGPDE